jgi:hypothetical protein
MSRKKKARERFTLIILLLASIMFLSLKCKDFGVPPLPEGSVRLSQDYVSCTEVWLKLAFTDNNNPRGFALLRDGVQLTSGSLTASDSLLVDTNVVAGHTYSYTAQRLNGSTAFDAATLDVRTLDSTSHSINWIVDTLGAQGVIRDVWVFDRNNAWAVGEIYLRDSTGQINMNNLYNAAQWNGTSWMLKRIPYDYQGQPYYSQLYSIYAFETNDIWYEAGTHWDGSQYKTSTLNISFPSHVNKIWGTSSNDLFIIGNNGLIAHRNAAGSWTQMTSNTTVDLQDIFGLDATHIWATGTNVSDGHSVVLQYNGSQWTTLYDNANKPPLSFFAFSTIWTSSSTFIYLAGGDYLRKLLLSSLNFGSPIEIGQRYMAHRIRGTASNDIFVAAEDGECSHFNGNSWYLYPELKSYSNGSVRFLSAFSKLDFILLGGDKFLQLNGIPIVIRGYR